MSQIKVTPFVQNLFTNVPIEARVTDAEIVLSGPSVALKTFSRHRLKLPKWVSAEELKIIVRTAQAELGYDAAQILAIVRDGPTRLTGDIHTALSATTLAVSPKEMAAMTKLAVGLATSSRCICVFDRLDSLPYLSPLSSQIDDVLPDKALIQKSCWLDIHRPLRYERKPRVFAVLTQGSLAERVRTTGDDGIEHLIGNVEVGEHSLTLIDDTVRIAHRAFRGIFADAGAVAIFDRRAMIVRPRHGRAFRLYEACKRPAHARIIQEAIREFQQLRRFRLHSPTATAVVWCLKQYLSYKREDGPIT